MQSYEIILNLFVYCCKINTNYVAGTLPRNNRCYQPGFCVSTLPDFRISLCGMGKKYILSFH